MRTVNWRGVFASGGVALAAYAVFLVVLAPATLIDAGLRRATAGRLRLAQAQGTLWSGSGVLEIRSTNGASGVGKDLSWVVQPRALLHAQLDYAVNLDRAKRSFPVHISVRGIELSNVDFSLPASALGVAVARMAPLGPRGDMDFHIANFSRADGTLAMNAVVTWKDASSALTTVAPLGTYQLRVKSAGQLLNATLRTSNGPLQLDGVGSWRGSGPWTLSAVAWVDARHRSQLTPLLRLIAVERGNGDFALQFGTPLSGVSTVTRPENP